MLTLYLIYQIFSVFRAYIVIFQHDQILSPDQFFNLSIYLVFNGYFRWRNVIFFKYCNLVIFSKRLMFLFFSYNPHSHVVKQWWKWSIVLTAVDCLTYHPAITIVWTSWRDALHTKLTSTRNGTTISVRYLFDTHLAQSFSIRVRNMGQWSSNVKKWQDEKKILPVNSTHERHTF